MFVYLAFKRLYSQVSHVMTLTWNDSVKICNRDAKLSPISASNLLMSFNVSSGARRRPVHQRHAQETLTKVGGNVKSKELAQGLGSSSRVSHMIKQQSKSTPVPCHSWEKAAVAEGRVPGFGEAMSNHDSAKKSPSCWPEETFALCVGPGIHRSEAHRVCSVLFKFWPPELRALAAKVWALHTVFTVCLVLLLLQLQHVGNWNLRTAMCYTPPSTSLKRAHLPHLC